MRSPSLPIVLGGGALAAYLWSRARARSRAPLPDHPPDEAPDVAPATPAPSRPRDPGAPPFTSPLPGRWVWPVPTWQGRRPVRSDGFGSPRPGGARHEGVDVMFAREPGDAFPAGSPNGSPHHVMPDNQVAVAASDGVVWSAGWTSRGFSVVVDHAPTAPVATYYTHLALLLVAPTARGRSGQRVRAGQPIGIIGADPLDPAHLKHLHFALWRGGPGDAVDPAPLMDRWEYVADPRAPLAAPPRVARNAALAYRPVGERGESYPEWVRNLRGKSGVYVIRERHADGASEVVYVGESHSGKLHETLTRHFQGWRRWKGFWRGQYGEGHDPGLTYPRGAVEVAARVTPASRAIDEEARLIHRLRPRDNLLGQPQLEPAPF
jgi:Peptidase family M23